MIKSFCSIDELLAEVDRDKRVPTSFSSVKNRYPIRFVLFDNFRDSYEFISKMSSNNHIEVRSARRWLDSPYDVMISHVEFSNNISQIINEKNGDDCIIASFSELTRFYDNKENKEFDSLITSLTAIETTRIAFDKKQRIYVIVVGQYGKISRFEMDPQIFIWYFKNEDDDSVYRVVLTDGTDYGVRNLQKGYTFVNTVKEWVDLWRSGADVMKTIVLTSHAIYSCVENALPDNAFHFVTCKNVYEFLTKGLRLKFGKVQYKEEDKIYWKELAEKIDVINFDFADFIKKHFKIYEFKDCFDFLKAWQTSENIFDKWLLTTYYLSEFDKDDYLYIVLKLCHHYTNKELCEKLILAIFDCDNLTSYVDIRLEMLRTLKYSGSISNENLKVLKEKLLDVEVNFGNKVVASLLTPYTNLEMGYVIQLLGKDPSVINIIQHIYPIISCYLCENALPIIQQSWLNEYFDKYKLAKFANCFDKDIMSILKEKNSNEIMFNSWYQDFKTVRTIVSEREDIEELYWIDGLGADWIPVIRKIIETQTDVEVYLNDVIIGKALLPTITEKNRADLVKIFKKKLVKVGNIDIIAHQSTNKYPTYIIEEFKAIEKIIHEIIIKAEGKKVAIVSDHGISYLSQYCEGLNILGMKSDHHGRLATIVSSKANHNSDKYIVVDDTIACSLTHNSLCKKVPEGQGAHGGATPEEVLVPVLIISPTENKITWKADLLETNVSLINPIVQFAISGLENETPFVIYNGKTYHLSKQENDNVYVSGRINFSPDVDNIALCVGSSKQVYTLNINVGTIEDDLF